MFKTFRFVSRLIFVVSALFLVSFNAYAESINSISNSNPQLGELVVITGSDLDFNINATFIIYPKGGDPADNDNRHYVTPEDGYPTSTEYKFELGNGEGLPLLAGGSYTFGVIDGPSVLASIDFSIASTGSNSDGCSNTDAFSSIYIKGIATFKSGDNIEVAEDFCEDRKTLVQVQCGSGGKIGQSRVTCEGACEEGVCVSEEQALSCKDTDSADSKQVLGKVTFQNEVHYDYCGEDDKTLYQAQCQNSNTVIYDEGTECEGRCLDGVCVNSGALECSDNDPKNDIYLLGKSTYKSQVQYDYCSDDGTTIYQTQCSGDAKMTYVEQKCPSAHRCESGVCVKQSNALCSDSDEKNDIYKSGVVNILGGSQEADVCDGDYIYQVSCDGGRIKYLEGQKCANGCSNGACNIRSSGTNAISCSDTDVNDDPYTLGSVSNTNGELETDICDGDEVYQAYCRQDGSIDFRGYQCVNGCSKGACLPTKVQSDETFRSPKNLLKAFFNPTSLVKPISSRSYANEYQSSEANNSNLNGLAYLSGETTFSDVSPASWFGPLVKRLASEGIVKGQTLNGLPTGKFMPSDSLNAAEALAFVLPAAGKKVTLPTDGQQWFDPYFILAGQLNLEAAKFPVSKLVTRGEVACLIADTLGLAKVSPNKSFNDVPANHVHLGCIGAMVNAGMMQGDSNGGTFRPDGQINRAEMAKLINLTIDKNRQQLSSSTCNQKDAENLRIYDFSAQPILEGGKIKLTKDGHYLVRVTAQVQSMINDVSGVNLQLFRHDLVKLSSANGYREVIKQVRTPYAWQGATVNASKITVFTAVVPVPKSPHLVDRGYEYVDFSLGVDLFENQISESVDVADNLGTTRADLVKESVLSSLGGGIPPLIIERQIQSDAASSTSVSAAQAKRADSKSEATYGQKFGLSVNGQSRLVFAPYRSDYLKDSLFDTYKTSGANPHQSHTEVLSTFFRANKIAKLDALSSTCINLEASALSVVEEKVAEDGRLQVRIKGNIKKTGKIGLPGLAKYVVSMRESGSSKPYQPVYWGTLSADDGSKDPYNEEIDIQTLIQPKTAQTDFILSVDEGNLVLEKSESDNLKTFKASFKLFNSAQAVSCKFDPYANDDLWVMAMKYSKLSSGNYKITAEVQSKYGTDLKNVNFFLFKEQVSKGQRQVIQVVPRVNRINQTIRAGRIEQIEFEVSPTIDTNTMFLNGTDLGYRYTVVADLISNRIEEVDEITNNIGSVFVPMSTAISTTDYIDQSLNKVLALGGQIKELNEGYSSFSDLGDYFASKYNIPAVGSRYQKQHEWCTDVKFDAVAISQLNATDGAKVKVKAVADLVKAGATPLPKGYLGAQLLYRLPGETFETLLYEWKSVDLAGDDGSKSQLKSALSTEIEFAPRALGSLEFILRANLDSSFKDSNHKNNETISSISLSKKGKVDLKIDSGSFSTSGVLSEKFGKPAMTLNYTVTNVGSEDINTPFKLLIEDENANQVATINIPYVKGGKYEGKEVILIDKRVRHEYHWKATVDKDKKILLDESASNNSTSFKWSPKRFQDVGLDIELDDTAKASATPVTFHFTNFNDTTLWNWKYYENGQRFPYQLRLKNQRTVNKPAGNGSYLTNIWKQFEYLEDTFDDYVGLHGGLLRVNCTDSTCRQAINTGVGGRQISNEAVYVIYDYFGDFLVDLNDFVSGVYSGKWPLRVSEFFAKFKSDRVHNKSYWQPSILGYKESDLKKYSVQQKLNLEENTTYILYGYLKREWDSYLTTDDNNDPNAWWYSSAPGYLYGRHAEDSYKDADNLNNYQLFKIEVNGAGRLTVKEIALKEAYDLTKRKLSSYGNDYFELLKEYYSGFGQ